MVESCGSKVVWTEPRDVDIADAALQVNAPGPEIGESGGVLSSYHVGGAQMGLADGSVRFVSDRIDPNVLKSLLTKSGGEEVGDW
ncbi:MAG: DUF1559 domain-containing protein [Planctomycetaceae bacterium]